MQTWSNYSLIPPLFVPTSIRQAPEKSGSQEIGRSRGGLTAKLHVAVDALGTPLSITPSADQIADIECATALVEEFPAQPVIADKGYNAGPFVLATETKSAQAVIPPRSNRKYQHPFGPHLYRDRNLVERFFCRIKQLRRIATRHGKLAASFLSFIHLACSITWLA